jgi:hypothetical protein
VRSICLLACILLLLWNVATAQAQRLTRPIPTTLSLTLTQEQVLEDLSLFQRIKERAHAGLYKYRTKAQMDSAFVAVRAQVRDGMTIQEVYRLVVHVTDFEGSLHNDTTLPDALRNRLDQQTAFFPYPVKLIAGRLLLDYTQGPLPVGTEIVAVDGRSVAQLQQALGRYYTSDGFNQTDNSARWTRTSPAIIRMSMARSPRLRSRCARWVTRPLEYCTWRRWTMLLPSSGTSSGTRKGWIR